jgi:hypothetical protein
VVTCEEPLGLDPERQGSEEPEDPAGPVPEGLPDHYWPAGEGEDRQEGVETEEEVDPSRILGWHGGQHLEGTDRGQ